MEYTYLLGFIQPGLFITMLVFAAIGVAIRLLWDAQKRDQNSKNTPEKFSLKFLLKDNWKTIVMTFLVILVTLRFLPSVFPAQFAGSDLGSPEGMEKWLAGSVVIGVMYNSLFQYWKKSASWLKVERKK